MDALDVEDFKSLLVQGLEEKAALRAEVAALLEENRRLKGLKGPPSLKPSGMDKETEPAAKRGAGVRRTPGLPSTRIVLSGLRLRPAPASRAMRTGLPLKISPSLS